MVEAHGDKWCEPYTYCSSPRTGVRKRVGIFNQIMVTNKFKFDTGMNVCIYKKISRWGKPYWDTVQWQKQLITYNLSSNDGRLGPVKQLSKGAWWSTWVQSLRPHGREKRLLQVVLWPPHRAVKSIPPHIYIINKIIILGLGTERQAAQLIKCLMCNQKN